MIKANVASPGEAGPMISEKILLIDDDRNIVQAIQRHLRKYFHIEVAISGDQGLLVLKSRGPFAVVVSDMKMAKMDGAQFLSRVKQLSPDTIRIILTGHANAQAISNAVNDAGVYRLLTKPCNAKDLVQTLMRAVDEYRRRLQAKQAQLGLMEQTVNMLAELLSLVQPRAFGRATRARRYVAEMSHALGIAHRALYEHAALLSQLGFITAPGAMLEKLYRGGTINEAEGQVLTAHEGLGYKILRNVQFLTQLAMILKHYKEPYAAFNPQLVQSDDEKSIARGANLLRIALDFDLRIQRGEQPPEAVVDMAECKGQYDPEAMLAMKEIALRNSDLEVKMVTVADLNTAMSFDQDVSGKNGILLASKGQEVTLSTIEVMQNYLAGIGIDEPFRVVVPRPRAT